MERMTIDSLIAYMDGEVTQNQAGQIERQLNSDPVANRNLQRLREIRSGVKAALQTSNTNDMKARILDRLKTEGLRRRTRWIPALIASMSAAILSISIIVVIIELDSIHSFTPRGSSVENQALSRRLGIQAYLHQRSDPFSRRLVTADSVFQPNDGFSFVLINRSGRTVYLLLFALDAQQRVHWFYPAMDTDEPSPRSVTIGASPQLFPLPDGVTPANVANGALRLIALFTDQPIQVADVESLLNRGGIEEIKKNFPDAFVQILELRAQKEVTP